MASKMLNVDPTKVKFEDVAGRRKIIQSHYEAQGWTNEEASQALHKRVVEGLCKALHAAGLKKIGHVYFEYMVDHSTWHDNFKHVKAMGFPVVEWPWPKRPLAKDESLGISPSFHEWLQRNGHEVPEDVAPLSADEMASRLEKALAKDPRLAGMDQLKAETMAHNEAVDKKLAGELEEKMVLKEEKEKNQKAKLEVAKAIFDQEVANMGKKGNKGKAPVSWADECEDRIVPDPVDLPIRPIFQVNKDKRVEQVTIAPLSLRHKLWRAIMGHGPFKTPVVGPFEVALPPWLDFHGLILGEDGKLYEEIESYTHEFLTVGWLVTNGRPVSLVVGFKASHEDQARIHRKWHDLLTLWGDCLTWVSGANVGSSTTLLESLTDSHWRRIASVRDFEFPGLTKSHLASENNLLAAEHQALQRYDEDEVSRPQVLAILNQQPYPAVCGYLEEWVRRVEGDEGRRLVFAARVWRLMAARNERVDQALAAGNWEADLAMAIQNEQSQKEASV